MLKSYLTHLLAAIIFATISLCYASDIPATYDFKFEHGWLTMKDGTKLAVDYYKPVPKTKGEKFPIVLEMLPYRKDDSFASRDYPIYSYFAQHGIVGVRIDIRGTGASDGQLPDREYSDKELSDILEAIDLLAAEPYSNGNIGMMGKSWSGINGVATAMTRPEHLKALIFVHSSVDLYEMDVHGWDGGLHLDMFSVEMDIENIMPKSPAYEINDTYFNDRFDTKPWIFAYLHHQRDGAFWRKGRSLFTDYPSVNIPIYAVGALLDGYKDSVPDMAKNMTVPIKAEMGTQNHAFPHNGEPGPQYEWRQTAVRWWQHWLNNKDTGLMDEPMNTVFMRDYVAPNDKLKMTPGKFWSLDREPKHEDVTLYLEKDLSLSKTPTNKNIISFKQTPGIAENTLNWWGEATGDMRPMDKRSLVFDTAPITESQYILGFPKIHLKTAADQPLLDWIVRLEDVAPDGQVSFITGALFHSSQYISRLNPKPFPKNKMIDIEFPLHYTTWTFKPGHRIRVAVSLIEFPLVWPTPYQTNMQLAVGDLNASRLTLPTVSPENIAFPTMPALETVTPRPGVNWIHEVELTPFVITHYPNHHIDVAEAEESSLWEVDGRLFNRKNTMTYIIDTQDPSNATFKSNGNFSAKVGDKLIRATSLMHVTSDMKNFDVTVTRELFEDNVLIRKKEWHEVIPRDFQ